MSELKTPFKIRWLGDDEIYFVVDSPIDTKMYTVHNSLNLSDYSKISVHDQIDRGRIQVIKDDPVSTPEATPDVTTEVGCKSSSDKFKEIVQNVNSLNKAFDQAEFLHKKYKTSVDFLDIVKDIQVERGAEYEQEEGERSFEKIVTVFNVYRGKDLLPSDIALILEIMKNVRFYAQDRYHLDSVIDKVSYGSLWAELVTQERA